MLNGGNMHKEQIQRKFIFSNLNTSKLLSYSNIEVGDKDEV